MRAPQDLPRKERARGSRRRRRLLIVILIVLVVMIASLRTFAMAFTDYLWFGSLDLQSVWIHLFEVKVGLFVTFSVLFGVLLYVNLKLSDRLAPRGPAVDAEDEFVRRYQEVVAPYSRWIRLGLTIFLSLVIGSQAIGQWNNWILFRNAVPFPAKDPLWGKNDGYYIFTLPFEQFLIRWALTALIVVLLFTVLNHYLNGGIRLQGPRPRVRPAVKAHISVLIGLIALVKAGGYVLARYALVYATNGFVQGAGYTDVHARVPALDLLILVSLAAAVLLIYNIRRQGWTLPILGVGLWFLVALTAGEIYPAAVQALKVNPAQNTLEEPYIQHNINATRAAFGLDDVTTTPYPAVSTLTAAALNTNADTLANVRLWDPTQTQQTYDKLQDIRSYYQFNQLAIDRYMINNAETPVIVGAREINYSDLPSNSWVNTHLQYTHGYGLIVSQANQATSSGGPVFSVQDVPPVSSNGVGQVTQPSVYFGFYDPGYVVANTKQPELDFQLPDNSVVGTHYQGDGGVQISNIFDRAMFALRFSDFNLLISNQITSQSRIMYNRDIQTRVHAVAPFLSLDADPYAALVNGHIDIIQDAYTTTSTYPYSQAADTSALTAGSDLFGKNFNYIRNSVKVVMDTYTGHLTFYVMDPNDPIIEAYEKAFPGMFTPASKMSPELQAHLRYPEDLFTEQAMTYGRYHITSASTFYTGSAAWTLSPSPGSGNPQQALATTQTTNAQGQLVSTGQLARMAPLYQVLKIPGQNQQTFNLLDAFVPVSQGSQIQTLSGFMIAGSDPGHYGQLDVFQTPSSQPVDGPALVSASIDATPDVSSQISLLNQNGSSVLLGNVLMIPISDGILYIQPLYVESQRNSFPALQRVIAVYGKNVKIANTLSGALTQVFAAPVSAQALPPGATGQLSPQVLALLDDAQAAYQQSQADLKAGDLGAYQNDINRMESDLTQIQALTGSTSTAPTTTPTTAPSGS